MTIRFRNVGLGSTACHVEQNEPPLGHGRREEKLVQFGRSPASVRFDWQPRLLFLAQRDRFWRARPGRCPATRRGRRLQQRMGAQFGGDDRQIAREPLQDPHGGV